MVSCVPVSKQLVCEADLVALGHGVSTVRSMVESATHLDDIALTGPGVGACLS